MTVLRVGSATDTGLVRRINQDQVLVTDGLYAVADGMGGHAAGEVASEVAVEALRASFGAHDGKPTAEDLRAAVRDANRAVYERAQSAEELRGMGTTLTAAALVAVEEEDRLAVANVGDSRAYVFTRGELTQLTEDHSVPEELVRLGQLNPDEVATHPQRHMLTRVLGQATELEVDLWEVTPFAGDRLLLCSDGLCRELTDDQIGAVLRRLADPSEAAKEFVTRARASGGADNITVVVIDIVDDEGRAEEASRALEGDVERKPVEAAPVPEAHDGAGAAGAGERGEERGEPHRRRVTTRVVAFVLLLLLVLAGAGTAVWYFGRETYYVGLASGSGDSTRQIVIYRGRPGGVLWLNPTVEERTSSSTADVLPYHLADLKSGKIETTLADARRYVANLVSEAKAISPTTTTLPTLPPRAGTTTVP